jgi:hypothetical protein
METRTLECTTGDCAWLGWPGATHIARRRGERQILKTGRTSRPRRYLKQPPSRQAAVAPAVPRAATHLLSAVPQIGTHTCSRRRSDWHLRIAGGRGADHT